MSADAKQELGDGKQQLREKTAEAASYLQENDHLRVMFVLLCLLFVFIHWRRCSLLIFFMSKAFSSIWRWPQHADTCSAMCCCLPVHTSCSVSGGLFRQLCIRLWLSPSCCHWLNYGNATLACLSLLSQSFSVSPQFCSSDRSPVFVAWTTLQNLLPVFTGYNYWSESNSSGRLGLLRSAWYCASIPV